MPFLSRNVESPYGPRGGLVLLARYIPFVIVVARMIYELLAIVTNLRIPFVVVIMATRILKPQRAFMATLESPMAGFNRELGERELPARFEIPLN